MKRYTTFAFFIVFLCASCIQEDTFLDNNEGIGVDDDKLEWLLDQNTWIYSQMKEWYFWADEMPDSLDCNFRLEPEKFFESLKVPQDRFSYCKSNDDYHPRTKGTDLNETVKIDSIYLVADKRVGYFYYSGFDSSGDVTDVVLKFKNSHIDELILDLRSNPGGSVSTGIHLCSLVAPKASLGKLFCTYRYNRTISEKKYASTGSQESSSYFNNDFLTQNRNLDLDRIFVLTGANSASCSELVVNCLRPYMEVITIGETTVGKDVGMHVLKNNFYKYILEPITFRTYNADRDSVPITGLIPMYPVEDNSRTLLGTVREPLLKKALEIIQNN